MGGVLPLLPIMAALVESAFATLRMVRWRDSL